MANFSEVGPAANLGLIAHYGPQTQQAFQRSQYLADALKELQDSAQTVRSPVELAAKLGSVALLRHQYKASNDALLAALRSDQQQSAAPYTTWLDKQGDPGLPGPQPPPQQPMPSMAPQPSAMPQPPPQQGGVLGQYVGPQNIQRVESGNNPNAISPAGAQGLMQLMPGTAAKPGYGVRPAQDSSPQENQRVGSDYYGALVQKYQGNQVLANIAYNWGPGNADHWLASGAHIEALPRETREHLGKLAVAAALGGTPSAQPSPAGGGGAAAPPPQPPMQQQGPPQGQMQPPQQHGPSPDEIQLAKELIANPQTYQDGVQYAQKLRMKYAEPTTYKDVQVNGVPAFYDPTDPNHQLAMGQVPQQAMNHNVETSQGAYSVNPFGQPTQYWQPPQGYAGSPPGLGGPPQGQGAPQGPPQQGPTMNAIPGGPGDPRAGQNLVNNEEKLRDDYNKTIAPYVAAREGYQKVVQAAKGATRADDIALVFGYMKTLDPNSTVREGEQAQVANSGTIPQTITNMYNKLITGSGALLPAQRAQFAQSAGQQFEVYQRTYDQATQRYGQMAQSYGFDPHRIVQQFPGIEPYHAPASAEQQAQGSGYSPDQAHTLMRFQGSRAPQGSEGNPFVPLNEGQYNKLPSGSWYVFTDGSVQRKP